MMGHSSLPPAPTVVAPRDVNLSEIESPHRNSEQTCSSLVAEDHRMPLEPSGDRVAAHDVLLLWGESGITRCGVEPRADPVHAARCEKAGDRSIIETDGDDLRAADEFVIGQVRAHIGIHASTV